MINELAGFPIMSILLTMNKRPWQPLLLCYFFTHAKHHLIKLKLYNN